MVVGMYAEDLVVVDMYADDLVVVGMLRTWW